MKVLEPGHIYDLTFLDDAAFKAGDPDSERLAREYVLSRRLTFVNREEGHEHSGTQTQEVLRALIDRTYHCDHCMPDENNAFIIHHLRMALVYHEARALVRKAEKGLYHPERVAVSGDGHFYLPEADKDPKAAPRREFTLEPEQKTRRMVDY